MDNTAGAAQVKFFPPLHEQRRSWALEILRRERVTTVLDAGCGEGVFLQHLTHAPPWRAHTPATPAPAVFEKPDFIHVRELHGVDIIHSDLLHAIDVTAPPKLGYGWTRFEELNISIWKGGIEAPNAAFKGIECIVATEVIEHLPEHVVDSFAPILLGNYAPRLLLVTTPCFDYNERFRAPGDEIWGFPDPTGRTSRTFRHPDHKFEWTADEFAEWSEAVAAEWGYEATINGLGSSITKDPWGRDGDTVRASQAVTFRRREGSEWATARAAKYAEWASKKANADDTQPHQLLATHHYEAHVGAEKPGTREDIAAAVKKTIQDIGSSDVTIFELWREDAVSTVCGGWLELLIDVLDKDDAFVIEKEGNAADDWKVQLPGVELHSKNPWQSTAKPDDAWGEGESSETTDDTETYADEDEYGEYAEDEYDGDCWDETEDGWAASDAEEWSKDESDTTALKTWEEWKPTPGWLVEANSWD